jgi:NifU-like protein involved in Fe-S cluster formation
MNPFGYPEPVWRLFHATPRAGVLDGPGVISAEATTPASKGRLRLQVKMEQSRIGDARFQAYGCPTTIAVGAHVAEQVVGREAGELVGIDAKSIREALEIPDDRTHCALLGEDLVRSLLSQVGRARQSMPPNAAAR